MSEIVQWYINKKQGEIDRKIEAQKQKEKQQRDHFIISLGLYEKVYAPDNQYSAEYNLSEWVKGEDRRVYYKRVPLEVTDEEFEQIKQLLEQERALTPQPVMPTVAPAKNSIATTLRVMAVIIFIFGLLSGVILSDISIAFIFPCWIISFVSLMLLLGFAEAIKLLQDIKNK